VSSVEGVMEEASAQPDSSAALARSAAMRADRAPEEMLMPALA